MPEPNPPVAASRQLSAFHGTTHASARFRLTIDVNTEQATKRIETPVGQLEIGAMCHLLIRIPGYRPIDSTALPPRRIIPNGKRKPAASTMVHRVLSKQAVSDQVGTECAIILSSYRSRNILEGSQGTMVVLLPNSQRSHALFYCSSLEWITSPVFGLSEVIR